MPHPHTSTTLDTDVLKDLSGVPWRGSGQAGFRSFWPDALGCGYGGAGSRRLVLEAITNLDEARYAAGPALLSNAAAAPIL